MKKKMIIAAGVMSAMISAHAANATSAAITVCSWPDGSIQWKTVMSPSASAALDWPDGAASARLSVFSHGKLLGTSTVADTSAKTAALPLVSLPAIVEDERIVDAVIEYIDGSGNVIASASARLGYVTGIGSGATRLVTETVGKSWNRAAGQTVVQIPEDATEFAFDSVMQTFDSPGWWECYKPGTGEHTLSLTTTKGEFSASICLAGSGLMIFCK